MKFLKNADVKLEDFAPGITRQIMGYTPNLMVVRVFFEKGAVGSNHTHKHEQVSYVEKGKFEVNIDGEKQVLEAGDAFVVAPNLDHGAVCLEDGILLDNFSPLREDFLEK
jgi:quercetin dioxygenase-like cupin family protein